MKFEDEFPTMDFTKHPEAHMIISDEYMKKYIMKHCLDKQKVIEAIERCTLKDHKNSTVYPFVDKNRLLRELGL